MPHRLKRQFVDVEPLRPHLFGLDELAREPLALEQKAMLIPLWLALKHKLYGAAGLDVGLVEHSADFLLRLANRRMQRALVRLGFAACFEQNASSSRDNTSRRVLLPGPLNLPTPKPRFFIASKTCLLSSLRMNMIVVVLNDIRIRVC